MNIYKYVCHSYTSNKRNDLYYKIPVALATTVSLNATNAIMILSLIALIMIVFMMSYANKNFIEIRFKEMGILRISEQVFIEFLSF